MPRGDLSKRDATDYASAELGTALRRKHTNSQSTVPSMTAREAMDHQRLYEHNSTRNITRVLFISMNTELLNPSQQSLDGYVDIADLFDEVHVLILRSGIAPKKPVLRVSDNVWIYTASSRAWWKTPLAGVEMAEQELEFASGFRADLIVALDPFESAIVAHKLGSTYNRPTQLHIQEDYSTKEFLVKNKNNHWRLFFPFFTIPHFKSVRVATNRIKNRLEKNFSIPDLKILPRYQNYQSLLSRDDGLDLKNKFKPLIFFMMFVGELTEQSSLFRVLEASQSVLRNPRLGLIVLGKGDAKRELVSRAKSLGIDGQVIFESKAQDIVPYLKSANLLIVGDTNYESEEVVLKGAALGVPLIMARTQKREDIFTHGESAYLYESGDIEELSDQINDLLNNIGERQKIVMNAQNIIRDNFHDDPNEYKTTYRNMIEEAFFVDGA